ncbi:MAG: RIP metalloprotease RseP, partial [Candidatus Brocadiae bacterium]|nr:RIP metalloprotease RseP [Candidatus Brocadiia bacterium]
MELAKYPHDEVEVLVERDGQQIPLRVLTEPAPRYMIGISGLGTTIESLEGGGVAQRLGLRVGDRIAAVNGRPVESVVTIKLFVREALGDVALTVLREGQEIAFTLAVPDFRALEEFVWSAEFESGATLAWVKEGSPAWNAGIRAGDRIVSKGGKEVNTWEEVLRAGARTGRKEHEIQWSRDGELLTARVTAVSDTHLSGGHLGILMQVPRTSLRRYGAIGAVRTGFVNVFKTLSDIFRTLRGFARREVSPRQFGGIVLIAQASYHAAQRGIGMFFYMIAVISGAIAFLNILPIPVLDGGHLLFVAIEKVRGRRIGQKALTIAQTVGFVFLVLLVVYTTRNDILRLLGW